MRSLGSSYNDINSTAIHTLHASQSPLYNIDEHNIACTLLDI